MSTTLSKSVLSKYKNDIKVYGNTTLKKKFSKNYINIPIKKTYVLGIPKSSTKTYLNNFLKQIDFS